LSYVFPPHLSGASTSPLSLMAPSESRSDCNRVGRYLLLYDFFHHPESFMFRSCRFERWRFAEIDLKRPHDTTSAPLFMIKRRSCGRLFPTQNPPTFYSANLNSNDWTFQIDRQHSYTLHQSCLTPSRRDPACSLFAGTEQISLSTPLCGLCSAYRPAPPKLPLLNFL